MKKPCINYKDVTVSFQDRILYSNFNLPLHQGDKVLISGKSGTGKTTLLKLLLGFAKPEKGTILFNKQNVDEKVVWNVRRQTTYVTQNLDIGSGPVSSLIYDILSFKANAVSTEVEKSRWLDFLELKKDVLTSDFEDLSGGEKQRVVILVSLLLGRDIFLLDEPTAYLDKGLKQKVADFFIQNPKFTVIVISHDTHWQNQPQIKMITLGE